jgi:NinB protein
MTDRQTYRLVNDTVRMNAARAAQSAPDGYVCEIRPETRRDRQNRLLWPLIEDVRKHCDPEGVWTADQWKLRFMNELDNEMQMLPCLYGGGSFVVGQRSSQLSVQMFSNLVEMIFKFGAEKGVQWSRKSEETRAEAA